MAVGIRLVSLSARFRHQVKGEVAAVREVSLDIAPGTLMTLLGPSGCGKTTTLRMIAGFQQPSGGAIFIGDREVTHVEASERNIGFVFQNYALFPHLNVFENVAYGLRVQRASAADIARSVGDVVSLVGLAGYERQMPHQLSGGEQPRVALARAIVIKPRVLLFDEPLSNLDAKLRTQMRGEIRDLQRRLGITTVYVTHDQEEAMAISDRIAVMNRGLVEQVGDAETLYRRPASAFVANFIGRSNLIAATVTAAGRDRIELRVGEHAHTVEGSFENVIPGMGVWAVVRPEAIVIEPAQQDGLPGILRSRTYLGEKADYVVETAGMALQVVRYNPPPAEHFAHGEAVSIRLPPSGVQLLAREPP
jgi:ABC-type Fe3+/spermidine/putrescine transport system ATPase subunit